MHKSKLFAFSAALLLIVCLSANVLTVFAQTTVPVPNAVVSAVGNTTGDTGSATSDSGGNYLINSWLGTDSYNVTAQAIGFMDTTISNIAVTGGSETSGNNILMPVSGGISGKVTDAVSGTPVTAAFVTALNAITGESVFSTSTDSNGNYQIITDLATGTYIVSVAYALGYIDQNSSVVSVTQGAMTRNVNVAMARSGVITGTITDSVSNAVQANVAVAASLGGTAVSFASTNSSGVYTLNTNLTTGTYSVSVLFPADHLPKTVSGVAVTAGSTVTENIAIDPSGIISGKVTSGGQGLPGASVSVFSNDLAYFGGNTTDSNGNYQITSGLGTDSYTVEASYPYATGTPVSDVSVTAGKTTPDVNIALTVTPTGSISGIVTSTTGGGVSNAYVDAVGTGFNEGSNYTDTSGNYIITGLPADSYNVTATATGYTLAYQYPVVVTANVPTTGVDLELTPIPSGVISGVVQTQGTPLPEYYNEAYMLAILAAAMVAMAIAKLDSPILKRLKQFRMNKP